MKLSTRTIIAEHICIISWVLSSMLCLIGSGLADPFFTLGLVCCLVAENYRAKLRREADPNAKGSASTMSNSFGRRLTWVWLLFCLLMSSKWFLIGGIRLIDLEIFKQQSVEVSGHVTAKDLTEVGIPTYHLTYHYDTIDGNSYEPRVAVSEETWYAVKKGDTISVQYLPDRPWRARLKVGNEDLLERRHALTQGCLGIVLFLIGIGSFFYLRRKYPKTKAITAQTDSR